jgi:hypothetical protein
LPDIDRGVCGNGVVEPDHNEDCDNGITDDAGHPTCYPAGSVAACHFDCSTVDCPIGFFCGNDAVCRKPAGIFKDTGHATQVDADHLLVGDFDHDGLGDVVAQTQVQMNVLFGDPSGALSDPFTVRAPGSNPTVGLLALDPDGGSASEPYTDLIFSASDGITTWRGRQDRTLAPTPYPSLQIGAQESRVIEARTTSPFDDILVLTPIGQFEAGVPGSVLGDVGSDEAPDKDHRFAEFLTEDAQPSKLVGNVAIANFYDGASSPCSELAFAFGTASFQDRVVVVTTCSSPTDLNIIQDDGGTAIPPLPVFLPAGAIVRPNGFGPTSADVNGDGHIDLLIDTLFTFTDGSGTHTIEASFVAYSVGDGTFSSSPTLSPADNTFSFFSGAAVLAVGQLTKATDVFPDTVLTTGIVLEFPAGPPDADGGVTPGPPFVIAAPQEWIDARVADINDDGFADVVAGSSGRVDIYVASGNALEVMTGVHYAVDGAASQFAIGDFDGDRVPDIAFRADHGDGTSDLDVMWGHLLSVPDDPLVVGRFGNIRTIGTGVIASVLGGNDSVGDLGVVVEGPPDAGSDAGPFSVSVLAGATNRQLQAPFIIQEPIPGTANGSDVGFPAAFSVGQLTAGDRHLDLASGALVFRTLDAGAADGSVPDGSVPQVADVQLAVTQSTGAAQLSADPSQLKFSDKIDSFAASTSCQGAGCNPARADWTQLSLVSVDLDGTEDAGVGNGVDEIVGVAPALLSTDVAHPTKNLSADGVIFWARFDGKDWKIQSVAPLGSLPGNAATGFSAGFAAISAADVNGDGANDVLALVDGSKSTTLLAYINQKNGQLPSKATAISLPAYSTDPGAPFHIVSIAAVDADSDPGKEIAMLTDQGGLFLAKSNAAGDSFTVTGPLCDGAALEACANNSHLRIPSGQAIAAIDVDGDGIQDLLLESNLTLHVYKGLAVDP